METLAAKVPPDLSERIEEYREDHDLNKSQAIRRLIEDGFETAELREELEERRTRDENTIRISQDTAIVAIAWIALLLIVDGLGWITFELQVGTAELGISLVATVVAFAVYRRYKNSTE